MYSANNLQYEYKKVYNVIVKVPTLKQLSDNKLSNQSILLLKLIALININKILDVFICHLNKKITNINIYI